MSVENGNIYGTYTESTLPYINEYGVATDKYGVISDPYVASLLLMEDGNRLLQENGSNILLG